MTSDGQPDVDALVARLRARVEERRLRGDYPDDVEDELGRQYRRIMARREVSFEVPEVQADMLRQVSHFTPDRIPHTSRLAAGDAVHKAVGRVVARQTSGVLEQVQEFADVLVPSVLRLFEVLSGPVATMHRDHAEAIHVLFDEVAELRADIGRLRGEVEAAVRAGEEATGRSQATSNAGEALGAEVRERLDQLETTGGARRFDAWFDPLRFDDEFRGKRDEVRGRYADLADLFTGWSPVLDIGCGRGEFVELLVGRGVDVRGVELADELVEFCRGRGLPVEHANGLAVLESSDDASLGGLAMLQVVEHLSAQQVLDVVELAARKVRPGGRVVLETVNPQSLYVFAHSFYLDPTHLVPIHPAYLTFLFREAGFEGVRIEWRSEPSSHERLDVDADADDPASENFRRLNQLLFAPQDYALVAFR